METASVTIALGEPSTMYSYSHLARIHLFIYLMTYIAGCVCYKFCANQIGYYGVSASSIVLNHFLVINLWLTCLFRLYFSILAISRTILCGFYLYLRALIL